MSLILVGDEKRCRVLDVVLTIMMASPPMNAAKLDNLMTLLHTDTTLRESIKVNLEMDKELLSESIGRILEEWKSRVTTVASLDALIYVLKHCDMAGSAEALRNKYYAQITTVSVSNSLNEIITTNEYHANDHLDVETNKLLEINKSQKQLFSVQMPTLDSKNMLRNIRLALQSVSVMLFVVLVFVGIKSWHETRTEFS